MDHKSPSNARGESRSTPQEEAFENAGKADNSQTLAAQSTPPNVSNQVIPRQFGQSRGLGLAFSPTQASESVRDEPQSNKGLEHGGQAEDSGILERKAGWEEDAESSDGFAQRALSAQPLESTTGLGFGNDTGSAPEIEMHRPANFDPDSAPEANPLSDPKGSRKSTLHEPSPNNHYDEDEPPSFSGEAKDKDGNWSNDVAWDLGNSAPSVLQDSSMDADPFKFLGQVNHTNSFPDVPPTHNPQRLHNGEPLPQSQVETIIEQDDERRESLDIEPNHTGQVQESEIASEQAGGETLSQLESRDALPAANDFFEDLGPVQGGEPSTPLDAEARYEEGIPLMPSNSNPEQGQFNDTYQEQSQAAPFNPFEDSPDPDEDFFSQSNAFESQDQLSFSPPPLDRKSTNQVLGSLSFPPHNETHDQWPPNPDEDTRPSFEKLTGGRLAVSSSTVASEVMDEHLSGRAHPAPQDMSTPETTKDENLAALWKAALEEDEFLDDDLLENPNTTAADAFSFDDDDDLLSESTLNNQESSIPLPVVGQDGQTKGFNNLSKVDPQINRTNSGSANKYSPSITASGARPSPSPYAPAGIPTSNSSQSSHPGGHDYPQSTSFRAVGPQTNRSISSGYGTTNQPSNSTLPRPPPVVPNSSQSYADQSKGGYSSPYDLPSDISRPRKRANIQQTALASRNLSAPLAGPPSAPPPRSSSMYASQPPPSSLPTPQVPAPYASATSSFKPLPSQSQAPPTPSVSAQQGGPPSNTSPSSKLNNFFEDLPMTTKARPSSGAGRYAAPLKMPTPPPPQAPPQQSQRQPSSSFNPSIASQMRPPERMNPYAAPPAQSPALAPQPNTTAPRYSPAPPSQPTHPQAPNRYTPPSTNTIGPSHTQSFQPRTSSPLAYQERRSRQQQSDSTASQSYQGVQSQVRSRTSSQSSGRRGFSDQEISPETGRRSLDTGDAARQNRSNTTQPSYNQPHHSSLSNSRYAPDRMSGSPPPPRSSIAQAEHGPSMSEAQPGDPQHLLHHPSITDLSFAPPRRSQTQSPGSLISGPKQALMQRKPSQRPASALGPTSPTLANAAYNPASNPTGGRTTGSKQTSNYITPTDGRELDPLQRWRGCPVFVWGFGGVVVSSFPKQVPRYAAGQTVPMMKTSPGEVSLRSIKDVYPLDDYLCKFPGPLRAKGKKKDIVAWLNSSIDHIESKSAAADVGSRVVGPKRQDENLLLWKVLRVFVEQDGLLEGNPTVEKAVRLVLSPENEAEVSDPHQPSYGTGADLMGISKPVNSSIRADPVDAQSVEELRKHLLKGDREKAVWHAVDKRLWAHAMLISSTFSKPIWKQVIQEFVRQEVKNIGDNTESLAALYEIFAGNWEESIDELVPPSARAGHQMISTAAGKAPAKNALDGLDRWRETLGLVLSNRSTDDGQALMSLGGLLASYGRVKAAHICYMFARSFSIFGGADDPKTSMALVGADHVHQPFHFAHTLDPLLLSEVYEFGLSLAAPSAPLVVPHLQAYKLYHATILAEYGYRTEALEYCLAIANGLKSTTKPSPYYNAALFASLDDLTKRLQQSPKDGSSGWISAPSMGKVSNSVWSSFEKFIAGDESNNGPVKGGLEVGPFSRIAGGTPVISRSPSGSDLYGAYSADGGVPAISGSNSRYAPAGPYAPRSSFEQPTRPSQDPYARSSYDPGRSSMDSQRGSHEAGRSHDSGSGTYEPLQPQFGGYEPRSQPHAYQPTPLGSQQLSQPQMSQPAPSSRSAYAPTPPTEAQNSPYQSSSYQPTPPSEPAPAFGGYEPQQDHSQYPPTQESEGYEAPSAVFESSGYEPPATTGYQPYSPPSYDPGTTNGDLSPIQEQPKRKSFMDDDEDDYSTKPVKGKAQKGQDADDAVKKAAAEDGTFITHLSFINSPDSQNTDTPAAKKGSSTSEKKGWFGGWFSSKKDPNLNPGSGPIRAKLGEESSFYYDAELKKWVNKKASTEATATPAAPPPPPKGGPRALSGKGPPAASISLAPPGVRGLSSAPSLPNLSAFPSAKMMPMSDSGTSSAGPGTPARSLSPAPTSNPDPTSHPAPYQPTSNPSDPLPSNAAQAFLSPNIGSAAGGGSSGPGSASGGSAPPSRPGTSAGGGGKEVESIDDLLGAPAARKGGTVRKGKKGRGYVDVLGGGGGGS